ncbi:Farnesyl pyrophosphate synthase [Porphyridium purpureum]|uniref:Farnesyl pyrophosphate synthase n=1 Tax=Porphyridium purpureum TaxID=35688 RepID=A0A5J4YKX2_PORPP|nr:Farnesyl pyrophosphate synthase [Porphyridium purpureum]|eukprot:POR7764..scf249_10
MDADLVKREFMAVFDELVAQLDAELASSFDVPLPAQAYMRKIMTYNVPHGKLTRGLAVLQCYKSFCGHAHELSAEETRQANMLGWCVEWLQACFLVADDIMDGSHTRRGQACYYKLPEIGLKAVNDSLILEAMIFRILKANFRSHRAYVELTELFREITFITEVGQLLDLTSQQEPGHVDLTAFTSDTLYRIYRYKTAYYSFYLSVALGMRLANVEDPQLYKHAERVCLAIGEYFQAQDDYLDCFGEPELIGKVGTDIEENKCTWLVVTALHECNASAEDRALLEANYGRNDKECVARVKELYRKLGIPDAFQAYEQKSYDSIRAMIAELEGVMPTGAFDFLLQKVYKRSK